MGRVRARKHYKNPNRFFEYWLCRLTEEAQNQSWKVSNVYSKALRSLRKYPLKLNSGKECQILSGFGPAICSLLDEKLLELSQKKCLTLSDAITCGNSLTAEELKTLFSTSRTIENAQPAIPSLPISTPAESVLSGVSVFRTLTPLPAPTSASIHDELPEIHPAATKTRIGTDCGVPSSRLAGGSYAVTLLVDIRETFGMSKLRESLRTHSVSWEARSLPIGDFVWVAHPFSGDSSSDENIVLGVVVERKRADDLASSIVDGRFMEQKGRMTRLGFRKIYLFEECGSMHNLRISYETLLQAMVNAQLIDGCDFINCSNGEQSVAYLSSLSRMFQSKCRMDLDVYSDGGRPTNPRAHHRLWGVPWTEFATRGKKSPVLPLREEFGRHLLQIHSITGPKACDVVSAFPTLTSLMVAYDSLSTTDEKKELLMKHKKSAGMRTMTQKISEMIFYLYNFK